MLTSDFDFDLPPELIAQTPARVRSQSRLLHLCGDGLADRRFDELAELLRPGDLLVANDTRVLKARLLGHKLGSGGRLEALIERIIGDSLALAQTRASKPIRAGARLVFENQANAQTQATVVERAGDFYTLKFDEPVLTVLERFGQIPLPPYIEHKPDADDAARYQTIYAAQLGSVAAPTAGLHFDETVFAALAARGIDRALVTLHVGAGTFKPVRDDNLSLHKMHFERYEISTQAAAAINQAKAAGRRIVAVGTTTLRTLESAANDQGLISAQRTQTDLFITPGYRFKVVDALVTNFHLPRSTLLMLISAFAGIEPVRAAYRHAIAQRYRFFSYGDAMLIEPHRTSQAASSDA